VIIDFDDIFDQLIEAHGIQVGVGATEAVGRMLAVELALEGKDHRIRVDRRAILKGGVLDQMERVDLAVRADVPFAGERRYDLGRALLEGDEVLKDMIRDIERFAVRTSGGIEADGVATAAKDERAALLRLDRERRACES